MKFWIDNPTAPQNRDRHGLLSVATELPVDSEGKWQGGIEWEEICGHAERANRHCDPLPAGMENATEEELEAYYAKESIGRSFKDEDVFALYTLVECSLVGGNSSAAELTDIGRKNLELGFDHVLAKVFMTQLREADTTSVPGAITLDKVALQQAIAKTIREQWKIRPVVHMSRSVSYVLDEIISKDDDDTLKLTSGETVAIWDVEDEPDFLAFTGPVFYGRGEAKDYEGVEHTANLRDVLVEQLAVVAHTCGATLLTT